MEGRSWGLVLGIAVAALGCGPPFTYEPRPEDGGDTGGAGGGGIEASSHVVTVLDTKGAPVAGAKLVVSDATGATFSTLETSSEGSAVADIPESGSVAAFWQEGDERFVAAAYEPPPEAAFQLQPLQAATELPASESHPSTVFMVDIANVLPGGADTFDVISNCDSRFQQTLEGTTVQISNDGCEDAPSIDAFIGLWGGGGTYYWGLVTDMEPNNIGVAEYSLQGLSTVFHIGEQHVSGISLSAELTSWSRVSKGGIRILGADDSLYNGGPKYDADVVLPLISNGLFETWDKVGSPFGVSEPWSVERSWRAIGQPPSSATFDAAAQPRLSALALDVASPDHPTLSWSVTDGSSADCVAAAWSWDSTRFSATLPPNRTSVRLPDIPEELAQYRPQVGSAHTAGQVAQFTSPGSPGHAACIDGTMPPRDPAAAPGEHFVSRAARASF